jgi:hypothetical protein
MLYHNWECVVTRKDDDTVLCSRSVVRDEEFRDEWFGANWANIAQENGFTPNRNECLGRKVAPVLAACDCVLQLREISDKRLKAIFPTQPYRDVVSLIGLLTLSHEFATLRLWQDHATRDHKRVAKESESPDSLAERQRRAQYSNQHRKSAPTARPAL